jgi:hypothetical protein
MCKFLAQWWDPIVFAIYAALTIAAWNELKRAGKLKQTEDENERRFGAQLFTTSSAAGVTAVSILVPASMLVVQLGWSRSAPFPSPEIVPHLFHASLWFLFSLILGLLVIFLVPFYSPVADVRKLMRIGIPFGLQIVSLAFGMLQLVLALYDFLFAKGG